ncbi:hypothetical protein [Glaciimonas immobilis]|uniref:Uncharacterized protein n=1 Tax=Glaciimonas immobilis TaxID=728004 RepID=A0A840RW00_9BURK|nr:hypothetical protein [Glaciimonas immobilis]KAF3997686.1 hypothetical protein HAV38_13575 [Glaciimonas immobilis]MBB5200599.1 hypothetical protein [Glaciimonas immobilis]
MTSVNPLLCKNLKAKIDFRCVPEYAQAKILITEKGLLQARLRAIDKSLRQTEALYPGIVSVARYDIGD